MTHRQQKHRVRHTVFTALAVLAALGILLMSVFRTQIARAEYPCRYTEYVTHYAEKYDIDPLILYSFIRTEPAG